MDDLLAELAQLLHGYNYAVFFRTYHIPFDPDAPAEWYVGQALGAGAVIGGIGPVTAEELLDEVRRSVCYTGDTGCGPRPSVFRSRRFQRLFGELEAELLRLGGDATLLAQFWLSEGHPAYPVFWDFAFVIAGPEGGTVFVGSSSD